MGGWGVTVGGSAGPGSGTQLPDKRRWGLVLQPPAALARF